jgi:hypothetical protein
MIGDLMRLRPQKGRDLIVSTYRRCGCNMTDTAIALGSSGPHIRKLAKLYGFWDVLKAMRAARGRLLAVSVA